MRSSAGLVLLAACGSSPAVPADTVVAEDTAVLPDTVMPIDALVDQALLPDGADAFVMPDAQLPSSVFAFDYVQRTPTAVQLNAVATWGDAAVVTGEASATFTTDDRWTTHLRRASPDVELWALATLDDTHVIAVGDRGALAVGSGRGATWTSCASATTFALRAVAVTGREVAAGSTRYRVVAVGEGGRLVRGDVTIDASGVSCGPFAIIESTTLYSLRAIAHDPVTGVTLAAGRDVLRSTDGGASWARTHLPAAYASIPTTAVNALVALPEGGFLVGASPVKPPGSPGASGLLASADGTAFTELPGFTTIQVHALAAAGPHRAWAAGTRIAVLQGGIVQGGPRISLARDDGAGWVELEQAVPTETANLVRAHAIAASGSEHAVWVSQAGTIVATDDGGATWSQRTRGTSASLLAIAQVPGAPSTAWGVTRGGEALLTTDAGQTWTAERAIAEGSELYSLAAPTPDLVFAVGANGTIVRRAAGVWSVDPGSQLTEQQLRRVRCLDAVRCYAVGRQQTLLAWNGTSWSTVPDVPAGAATYSGIDLYTHAGITRGVLVGSSGTVATLEGDTWTVRTPVAGVSFVAVALAPDGSGRARAVAIDSITQAPLVYASIDHGVTWVPAPAPAQLDAARFVAYDASTSAWFIGGLVSLWRSRDDGTTWRELRPGVSRLPLNGLSVGDGHVYTVGNGGLVAHSASGGILD